MRTSLRKIGNSRGIIIPASLLAACNLGEEVDIRVKGNSLLISPTNTPRVGWFDNFHPNIMDAAPLDEIPMEEGADEWVW